MGIGSDSQFDDGKLSACVFQSSHGAIVRGKNSHSIVVGRGADGIGAAFDGGKGESRKRPYQPRPRRTPAARAPRWRRT